MGSGWDEHVGWGVGGMSRWGGWGSGRVRENLSCGRFEGVSPLASMGKRAVAAERKYHAHKSTDTHMCILCLHVSSHVHLRVFVHA